MVNDVITNKIASIERCINRINEVYNSDPTSLNDYTKQDSIILNIQRACECSIDLAMHIVAEKHLGIPQSTIDAFDVLEANGILTKALSNKLKPMVGFRNIAVHDYQSVNMKIVQTIIERHLVDFEEYVATIKSTAL